jgi:hypothetical protein
MAIPRDAGFYPSSSWGSYSLSKQAQMKGNRMNKTAPEQSSFVTANAGESFEQARLEEMLDQQNAVSLAKQIETEQAQLGSRYNTELPTLNGQITQAAFDPATDQQLFSRRNEIQSQIHELQEANQAELQRVGGQGIKGGSLLGAQKVESSEELTKQYQDYIKQLLN